MKAIQAPTRVDLYAKADRHLRSALAALDRSDASRGRTNEQLALALEQLDAIDLRSLRDIKVRDAVRTARNDLKFILRQQTELRTRLEGVLVQVGTVLVGDTLAKAG